MRISSLYVGISLILIVVLSFRVVLRRWKVRVGLGDGGDMELRQRIRAHGNAVEYLPMGLLALLMLEIGGAGPMVLHGCGGTFIFARVVHAIGLSRKSGVSVGREIGMPLTWLAFLAMAWLLLSRYLHGPGA
ncbi:MAPEG family protein [Dyella japonica]|uniref:MAPEG family protein n=1 Tax=Dyella japonica TaxID=231455 RepID=UPI0009DB2FE9